MKKIASERNYTLVKRADMYEGDRGEIVWFRALHSKVLIVVIQTKYDWRAVIMAVPGSNHKKEVADALAAGDYSKLSNSEAQCLWGGLIEDLDRELGFSEPGA